MFSFSFGTFSFLPLFLIFILTQTEAGDTSGETGGRGGIIPSPPKLCKDCTRILKMFRGSHRRCSVKKCVLKYFAYFTGKHLCWSLFKEKWEACNFIKRRLKQRSFPVKLAKFLRTRTFIEHLRTNPSEFGKKVKACLALKDIGIRVRSDTNFVMPALFHPIIPIFLTVLLRKCFFF